VIGSNILFEIADSSGNIVYKDYFANENINTGEIKTYSKTWTPNKSGQFTLRGGVFNSNWNNIEWFENIGTLNISAPIISSSSIASSSSSYTSKSSSSLSTSSSSSSLATSSSKSSSSSSSSVPTISSNLNVWWPANDVNMTGAAPFNAMVDGKNVRDYTMYWQVDGGGLIEMYNSDDYGGYKFFWVDFNGWTWKPKTEKYKITFVAKDNNGQTFATNSVNIFANK
jgi:hypothetical protein